MTIILNDCLNPFKCLALWEFHTGDCEIKAWVITLLTADPVIGKMRSLVESAHRYVMLALEANVGGYLQLNIHFPDACTLWVSVTP